MKTRDFDYWVAIDELRPPLGENRFVAVAKVRKIGGEEVSHNLGELWAKTREEAHDKMTRKVMAWIKFNEKHPNE